MAQVKLLLNLGSLDVKNHSLPPGNEGDALSVDDRQRNILVNVLRCAVDLKEKPTPPAKSEEKSEPQPAAVKAKTAEPKPKHKEQ